MVLRVMVLVFLSVATQAQTSFNISGTVKTTDGKPIESATVFINGSKQITKTDAQGNFIFPKVNPGTYEVVVNMIGFASVKQNVIIQDKSVAISIALSEKQIVLAEVMIGDGSGRAAQVKTFIKNFLGESENARNCKILNTELLDFSTKKTLLEATTSDFLLIENRNLGYNIKYLLRNFRFNSGTGITSYDGESIFENMQGDERQQAQWKVNRKKAYEGSLMHYLRSLYLNTTREEGFLTYNITNRVEPLTLDPNPVNMEQFLFTVDSNFVEMKFKQRLYIIHDVKAASVEDETSKQESITKEMGKNGSIMQLYLTNAVIDKKGSYVDYRSFYIQGFWGRKRIGDQLPFEYQPGD
ncbi:carboxypeptidase-like regulatory domain-containing protein [Pedobacter sp. PWIIR3]